MGSKDAPQEMQVLSTIKKAGKSVPEATKRRVAENRWPKSAQNLRPKMCTVFHGLNTTIAQSNLRLR